MIVVVVVVVDRSKVCKIMMLSKEVRDESFCGKNLYAREKIMRLVPYNTAANFWWIQELQQKRSALIYLSR